MQGNPRDIWILDLLHLDSFRLKVTWYQNSGFPKSFVSGFNCLDSRFKAVEFRIPNCLTWGKRKKESMIIMQTAEALNCTIAQNETQLD